MLEEHCDEKIDKFINKLTSLGYTVRFVSKKPQYYEIDGQLVNLRCTRTMKEDSSRSRKFLYSVNYNAMREARWFIYLMTESDYFIMFPREFLCLLYERMYPDHSKPNEGVFDIEWDEMTINLQGGEKEDINPYYHNLIHKEDYPDFKKMA